MGSIIICGGGVIGLSAAIMLARDGHQVTVLEADPDGAPATPGQAWASWTRHGVAQFRQPHNFFPRFRQVCEQELPGLLGRLRAAGCPVMDYLGTPRDSKPAAMSDAGPGTGDETFRSISGRRPLVESVIAAAAEDQPGVTIRRGARVTELLQGSPAVPGVPHVTGVRTSDDHKQGADLVIDAMGRRSPGVSLLTAVGARPPQTEAEECGFTYYTRYFSGPYPERLGPMLMPLGTITLITIAGDNQTWSVTVFSASTDAPVKALRDAEVFTRVVRACPLQANWLDGEPVTGVLPMAGIMDRYRRAGHQHRDDARPTAAPHGPPAPGRPGRLRPGLRRGHRAAGGPVLPEPDQGRPGPAGPDDRAARGPDPAAAARPGDQPPDRRGHARPGRVPRTHRHGDDQPPPYPGPDRARLLELLA
jgi:2-polyprenyl-6-methoxyphenol hydroxylase-like FAD-dependent oxidoreductase